MLIGFDAVAMKSSSFIMAVGALAFLGLFSNTSAADLFRVKYYK